MTMLGFDAMMIAWGGAILALAALRHFYFDWESGFIEVPGCKEQG